MSIEYKETKIAGTFSQLSEQNRNKDSLDPQEEYVFELVEAKDQQMKSWLSPED